MQCAQMPDAIEKFRGRCRDLAARHRAGRTSLADAVDAAQNHAEAMGLVAAIGQDHVQWIMAEAFSER